jgi:hypothetical protein
MPGSIRVFAITGALVVCYCLAVSLGPGFLFREASSAGSDDVAAQAQFPAAMQESKNVSAAPGVAPSCASCVQAASR